MSKFESTILITGGCGFIGTNLTLWLAKRGYAIRILDNLVEQTRDNYDEIVRQKAAEIIVADITNRKQVDSAIKGINAVVHLAAETSVTDSLRTPRKHWLTNVDGMLNILEATRQQNINTFIFASSNAVTGEQAPPINEELRTKPISPYGASKLAGEALCSAYYNSYDLQTYVLRFANCYGPYSKHKTSVVNIFLNKILTQQPLIVFGDGTQTRDFIHVNDICQAIELCLFDSKNPLTADSSNGGEIFQIATGIETSVNDLVSELRVVTGKNIVVNNQQARKGEIIKNYSDITKARKMLGFDPKVTLSDGLTTMWKAINVE